MERLRPKPLDISHMSLEDIRKLPLAVVTDDGENITIYKIEGANVRKHSQSLEYEGRFYPLKDVLEATKRFGKPISEDVLLEAYGFMPEEPYLSSKGSYAIWKVKFEKKKKNP